jgi:branched-chain amino acid transport system substrate-binding protein
MKRRQLLRQTAALLAMPSVTPLALGAEPGVSSNQVTIGCSLALSGGLGGAGTQHVAGVQAAFKAANARGGVVGRELKLLTLDDAYVPARTAENVNKLLSEQNTFALISTMGTGNTAAILQMVEKAGAPLVGPVTGAASLRQPGLKHVFHVRASYRDETTRLLQQMLSWGISNIALVYLDNPFGKEVLKGAEAAFAERGVKSAGTFALAADGTNGQALAEQVAAVRPGAVFLATTGTANTAFLLPLRKLSFSTPVAGLSVSVIHSELPKLGGASQGLALTQVLPDPSSTRSVMVRNYQAAMRAAGSEAQIGSSSLEGWINAQVMIEGLRRTGTELRRDRLRSALAGIQRMDLGDFSLGFSAQAPFVASQYVDLAVLGANGKRLS